MTSSHKSEPIQGGLSPVKVVQSRSRSFFLLRRLLGCWLGSEETSEGQGLWLPCKIPFNQQQQRQQQQQQRQQQQQKRQQQQLHIKERCRPVSDSQIAVNLSQRYNLSSSFVTCTDRALTVQGLWNEHDFIFQHVAVERNPPPADACARLQPAAWHKSEIVCWH